MTITGTNSRSHRATPTHVRVAGSGAAALLLLVGTLAPAVAGPQDEGAAQFERFPYGEAFAAFDCEASGITPGLTGGSSMVVDCSESTVEPDAIGAIPALVRAAAGGDVEAQAVFNADGSGDPTALAAWVATRSDASNAIVEMGSNNICEHRKRRLSGS